MINPFFKIKGFGCGIKRVIFIAVIPEMKLYTGDNICYNLVHIEIMIHNLFTKRIYVIKVSHPKFLVRGKLDHF